jgi:hypothetical protein
MDFGVDLHQTAIGTAASHKSDLVSEVDVNQADGALRIPTASRALATLGLALGGLATGAALTLFINLVTAPATNPQPRTADVAMFVLAIVGIGLLAWSASRD